MEDLQRVVLHPQETLRRAMEMLDTNAIGIVLVVDDQMKLLGTITDGDIRRAILAGRRLETPISAELDLRATGKAPVVGTEATVPSELLAMMRKHSVRHLPLVAADGTLAGLSLMSELIGEKDPPLTAVVMAGGFGSRLRPLTDNLPKPMLPLGDRPVMEHVIRQLKQIGISRICITTHYLPEPILEHFGNGARFGLQISYINEEEPLGTAGALGLMERPESPVLVVNGDLVTQVNFRSLADFHRDTGAELTLGVRQFDLKVPYGVVEIEGEDVRGLNEKPVLSLFINAGIYLLSPSVFDHIEKGEHLDATELIERIIATGGRVVSFPIHEYWMDMGGPADYQQAIDDVDRANGRA